MFFCDNCGAKLREGEPFCPHCGKRISVTAGAQAEKASVSYTEAEFELEEDETTGSTAQEKPAAEPSRPREVRQAEPAGNEKRNDSNASSGTGKDGAPDHAPAVEPEPVKKFSGLSIAAFICSLTVFLSGIGVILAIVDLAKSRNQDRKKGLSVAALIISGSILVLSLLGNILAQSGACAPKEPTLAEIAVAGQSGQAENNGSSGTLIGFTPAEPQKNVDSSFPPALEAVAKEEANQPLSERFISIACSEWYVAAVRENGKVAVTGIFKENFSELSDWTDIIAIDMQRSNDYILGLKRDGTVLICFSDSIKAGKSDLSRENLDAIEKELRGWRDIVSIEAGMYTAYGVTKDGNVFAVSFDQQGEPSWEAGVRESVVLWSDIAQVKEIGASMYGQNKDGSWMHAENNTSKRIAKRTDIADLDGTYRAEVVLFSNGNARLIWNVDENNRYSGGLLDVVDSDYNSYPFSELPSILSSWTNLREILVFNHHIIGLKQDGTVVSVYNSRDTKYGNDYGQCDVSEWRDVIDIAGTDSVTYGLRKDGTIIHAGIFKDKFDLQ